MSWIVRYPDGSEIDFLDCEYAQINPEDIRIKTSKDGETLAIIVRQTGLTVYRSDAKITKRT
jgi:hypothetical protein